MTNVTVYTQEKANNVNADDCAL